MSHIFISYAHQDSDFVELLRIKLGEVGIQTWVDHSGIKAGMDWRMGIDLAIKDSTATVLIMSPDSVKSLFVTYEWSYAHGLGKMIIPLMYRITEVHPKLETLQYLDFTHRTLRPWDELILQIKSIR